MTLAEMINSDNALVWAAGLAGAAAMAATDWRSPWRLAQHVFVGTTAAIIATPLLFPMISGLLGFLNVDEGAHQNSAAFMTGAFAIYLFEYILAFWNSKMMQSTPKEDGDGHEQ
tara:strand:- start:1030 stop:1371 length:342 start_codon:yes stop_codon:yes gene_type:complete